jgi:molecular chaperone GrpE
MNDDDEVKEDVDFEPEDELGTVGAAQAKIKKLRSELKETQAKRDEYLAGWQRAKADAINTKNDALRNADRAIERAKEALVEEILPALDSFDMAAASESWDVLAEEWKSGIGRMHNQLLEILRRNGVIRFGEPGEIFDPRKEEALQEVDDGDGESHTVLKVIRHGYMMDERVIRPAQVIIRK